MVAALELFSEGGARSVTHRSVAAQAGVPAATVGYYFGSIDELMYRAFEENFARWIADMGTYVAPGESEHTFDELLSFLGLSSNDDELRLNIRMTRLFLSASDDERLRPLVAEAVLAIEGAIETLLRRAGLPHARETARAIAAMVGGCAMRIAARRDRAEDENALMRRAIHQLVAASMLPPEMVDEKIRALGL